VTDPRHSHALTRDQAYEAVRDAILRIVPDADLANLDADASLRDELELDSLDFLSFVELLSGSSGVPITEADYPRLRSIGSCLEFLANR
jgi:acyl carrier protein